MLKERVLGCSYGGAPSIGRYNTYGDSPKFSCSHSTRLEWVENMSDYFDTFKAECNKTARIIPAYLPGEESFYSTELKKPLFNNCNHWIFRTVNYPFHLIYVNASGAGRFKYYSYFLDSRSLVFADRSLLQAIGGIALSGAQRRAWWNMQPRFEGQVSMLNFLYELKDFKDIMRLMGNFPSLLGKLRRGLRKPGLDPTKPLAELHLLNEFAIKPLVNDLAAISSQLMHLVSEAENRFQAAGLEIQKSHFSEILAEENNLTVHSSGYPYYYNGIYKKTTFNATLEYKYNYSMRSWLDAFTKYWGLQFTGEVLWNALPFSFLVDYVAKIGNSFRAMEIDKHVDLMPTQYCESIETRRTSGMHISGPSICGAIIDGDRKVTMSPSSTPELINGCEGSHYQRYVTSPNKGMATPRFTTPSGKQQLNMAALLRCLIWN
jgi:hypothetical protein